MSTASYANIVIISSGTIAGSDLLTILRWCCVVWEVYNTSHAVYSQYPGGKSSGAGGAQNFRSDQSDNPPLL